MASGHFSVSGPKPLVVRFSTLSNFGLDGMKPHQVITPEAQVLGTLQLPSQVGPNRQAGPECKI